MSILDPTLSIAPRVYHWYDFGAPVLTNSPGSLLNVLDACLVDGFGAKFPLNWQRASRIDNVGVYRMGLGLRHYIRVDDTGSLLGIGPAAATVVAFGEMFDQDTGTGRYLVDQRSMTHPSENFPEHGYGWDPPVTNVYAWKSWVSSSSTEEKRWVLIGDERTFYLFVRCWPPTHVDPGSFYPELYFGFMFGEYYSLVTGVDQHRSALIGGSPHVSLDVPFDDPDDSFLPDPFYDALSDLNVFGFFWNPVSRLYSQTFSYRRDVVQRWRKTPTIRMFPNPNEGKMMLQRVFLYEPHISWSSVATLPEWRGNDHILGYLRGLHVWDHALTNRWSDYVYDGERVAGICGPTRYLIVAVAPNESNAYVMDTEAWPYNLGA